MWVQSHPRCATDASHSRRLYIRKSLSCSWRHCAGCSDGGTPHDEENRIPANMDATMPSRPADPRRIRVVIVGAGLGGLACAMAMHYQGFEVLIFEKTRQFLRLGDSLGLGENALKLLERWGLRDELVAIGNKSHDMNIRRWQDGKILATQPLMVGSSDATVTRWKETDKGFRTWPDTLDTAETTILALFGGLRHSASRSTWAMRSSRSTRTLRVCC